MDGLVTSATPQPAIDIAGQMQAHACATGARPILNVVAVKKPAAVVQGMHSSGRLMTGGLSCVE